MSIRDRDGDNWSLAGTLSSTSQSSDSGEGDPNIPSDEGGLPPTSPEGINPLAELVKSKKLTASKLKQRRKRGGGKSATVTTPDRLDAVPEEPLAPSPLGSQPEAWIKEMATDQLAHRYKSSGFHPLNCECRCCTGLCHICHQHEPSDDK